jgi:hypothetical protein
MEYRRVRRESPAERAESDDVVAGDNIFAARQFQRKRFVRAGMAVKSNVSKLLTAGKRAAGYDARPCAVRGRSAPVRLAGQP